jgi:hypothetical protein
MYLKDLGVSPERAVELLNEHYNPRCEPPWDLDDLVKKVTNAFNYATLSKVGGRSAEAHFAGEPIKLLPPPKDRAAAKARKDAQKMWAERRKLNEERVKGGYTETFPTKQELIDRSVYIKGMKLFLCCDDPDRKADDDARKMYGIEAFDKAFMYLRRKGDPKSFSEVLLQQNKGTVRRFDGLVYKPGKLEFVRDEYNLYHRRPKDTSRYWGPVQLFARRKQILS